jgi:hypothetical protein
MGARLDPAERDRRAAERRRRTWAGENYKKYDPAKEGYGSVEDWVAAAEAMAGSRSLLSVAKAEVPADLVLLFLDAMPPTMEALKKAYRNSLFAYHPDHGGTDAQCIAAQDAFARLCKNYA